MPVYTGRLVCGKELRVRHPHLGTAAKALRQITTENRRPGTAGGAAPCRFCDGARIMAPPRGPEYDGFLHFIPAGAHCVLPRWSPEAPSRNLAL